MLTLNLDKMNFRPYGLHLCLMIASFFLIISSCNQQKQSDSGGDVLSGNPKDQLETINDQIKVDSLNPELFDQKAMLLLEREQFNDALASIRKAIVLNPRNPDYYISLSDIYLSLGKIKNCKESLEKAIEIDPTNNDAILKLAELSLIIKDYEKVRKLTNRAIENQSVNPRAYFIKGYAFLEMGDTNSAIGSMIRTIEQDGTFYGAYMQLGLLYSLKNDRIAVDYFNSALRIEPESIEALYALAMFYQENEDFESAQENYHKILQIDPGNKFALYNIGYIELVINENFTIAREYFSQVIEIDPMYADAYYNKGYCFELEGNLDDARRNYNQTLQVQPNHSKAIGGLNRLDEKSRQ